MEYLKVEGQVAYFKTFEDMLATDFNSEINAHCWKRTLQGDYDAIIKQIESNEDIVEITREQLANMSLGEAGQTAREQILEDLEKLEAIGASPVLNLISRYNRDNAAKGFPTDVYSFHVDRAPMPIATYLCTYAGASSEILPNASAEQKIKVPAIRKKLLHEYQGDASIFEKYLEENFYDLHYQAKEDANIISCGNGHLWRLAVDCKGSGILPCIHRAPLEGTKGSRLLLIC